MRSLIFDLDGTLWDPSIAVANAWNRVLTRNQIPFPLVTSAQIQKVTGLPHEECVRKIFAELDETTIQRLNLETQTEDQTIFNEHPLPIFPGVSEGIAKLSLRFSLFIVSNCQPDYVENFLKASELENYFHDWECWGITGKPKPQNVQILIATHTLTQAAFIGDTAGDEEAASANGLPYYHVAYGYGVSRNPSRIFKSFQELTTYFLSTP